jgi:hypothetical protein
VKVNPALILFSVMFFFYCCFERTCIAIMNLNQPTMIHIVVSVWLVFHHQTELVLPRAQLSVLQCCGKGTNGMKEVAGGGVRRTGL